MLFKKKPEGFTLIEILVSAVIISTVGLSVFGILQTALRLVSQNKAKEGAIALANEQMELVRNLSYNDIGVIGGVVSGNLLQQETKIRNNHSYTLNTNVIYIDDVFDGTQGGNPDDAVNIDYKKVVVTVNWNDSFGAKKYQFITFASPKGIETTAGGGTLRVNVIDAVGLPVDQANVRIINTNVNPPIDTTLTTGANGILNIPGLLASNESYSVSVTKLGYSVDFTCAVDPLGNNCTTAEGNPVPAKPHATVIAGLLTEITMSIDRVSTLTINTVTEGLAVEWKVNTDTTAEDQTHASFEMCPNGKYVFVWNDMRESGNERIFTQQYNQTPTAQWSPDIDISSSNEKVHPDVAVDSVCNAYYTWSEEKTGNEDIYFDKYDSLGNDLWTKSQKINTAANSSNQRYPQILAHNNPDYEYILWQDDRNDTADIFFQRFDNNGDAVWPQELRVNAYDQLSVQQLGKFDITNLESVYFTWEDNRNGNFDIYAQRLTGTTQYLGMLTLHHLDDGSGASTFLDSSGNGHNGLCSQCPDYTASGKIQSAFEFDGNKDFVYIPHDDAMLVDQGTVAFWFYPNRINTHQGLWSKDSDGYDNGGHLTIQIDSNNALTAQLESTTQSHSATSNSQLVNKDQWHSVVVTFGAGGFKLYLNGLEVAQNTYTGGLGTSSQGAGNNEPIVIGADSSASDNQSPTPIDKEFYGIIDEVIFLNYSMDETGVAQFHNAISLMANDQKINTNTGDSTDQKNPDVAVDSNNLPTFVWEDEKNGDADIYAQRYDGNWTAQFTSDIKINSDTQIASQVNPSIAIDCNNKILIAWADNRNGDFDIYLQQLNSNGQKLLIEDRRLNAISSGDQKNPKILINNLCNAVISFEDNSAGHYDIKAAQFTGDIINPSPYPNVPLIITGAKKLGTNPILYKYNQNWTTDGAGVLILTNLEWDSYKITTTTNLFLYKSEPEQPISILPNTTNNSINIFVKP